MSRFVGVDLATSQYVITPLGMEWDWRVLIRTQLINKGIFSPKKGLLHII